MPDTHATAYRQIPFTDVLVERGALSATALDRAIRLQAESGETLSAVLTKLGLVSERILADAFAAYLDLAVVAARDFPDSPLLDERISRKFLKRARLVPLDDRADGLVVAMADPLDDDSAEALAFALGKPILRQVALPDDIDAAYERLYGGTGATPASSAPVGFSDDAATDDIERLKDLASEAPVIRLVNQIIDRAVEARASDIHLEPTAHGLRVRYRIDGVLQELDAPPAHLRAAIVSRLKIMARLNIAERRLSQDGRIRLSSRGKEIDLQRSLL